MKIYNIHERKFHVAPEKVGTLIDSLASKDDRLWPKDNWPPMKFDIPIGVGAKGGHGPIIYSISEYIPGKRIAFVFNNSDLSKGLDGRHFFEVVPRRKSVVLRHVVDADCNLKTWLKWHAFIGPLHDALLEDALDNADKELSDHPKKPSRWNLWVRFLRRIMSRKR